MKQIESGLSVYSFERKLYTWLSRTVHTRYLISLELLKYVQWTQTVHKDFLAAVWRFFSALIAVSPPMRVPLGFDGKL